MLTFAVHYASLGFTEYSCKGYQAKTPDEARSLFRKEYGPNWVIRKIKKVK